MEHSEPKILVIIPAYNEEETIGGVIEDVKKEMPGADIVVVNDGSTDSTPLIVMEFVREFVREKGVTLVSHPYTLRRIANMETVNDADKKKTVEEIIALKQELGEDYLQKEKDRQKDIEKEIIIAIENQKL